MRPLPPLAMLLPALAALAGCAEDGAYPSLAQRPAELEYAKEAAAVPAAPAPATDDPEVAERVAALTAEARAGESEFEAAFGPASAAVAKAGAAGSDSWVEAQQALSRVTAAQARTTRALADLDGFALSRAGEGPLSPADEERLRAGVEAAQAIANRQAERLARLEQSLSRG